MSWRKRPTTRVTDHVRIMITEDLAELFDDFKPVKGAAYDAERHLWLNTTPGYVIVVNGHRVAIRAHECVEVSI